MAKTTLKISHPHMAVPKKQNKKTPPSIATYPPSPVTPEHSPALLPEESTMQYPGLSMTPPPLSSTVPRKPVQPRPSSSVYISRTSQVFEPVISDYNANNNSSPPTEFYWKPARYDNELTALPQISKPRMQDLRSSERFRLSNRYLDDEENVRESVLLLASIMPRDDDEDSLSSVYAETETGNNRPVTYLPALEQVYHRALNHEDSPEEDVFPAAIHSPSQNKAYGVLGLDSYRSHSPQLLSHETLLSTPRTRAATSNSSTPSLAASSKRASYESTSTIEHDAFDLAKGYHDLLTDVYHSDKQTSPKGDMDSSESISAMLRLVPAPLFSQSKQRRDLNTSKAAYAPLATASSGHSRQESTDSDRFHASLFKPRSEKPSYPQKMQQRPRLPFVHERKPSSSTSMFMPTTANITSKLGSALDKAKGSLAVTLSSIAENLEASQEKSRSDRDESRKLKLKSSIQVVGPCDANAAIVAERLKSVPLGVISS